jgi:hypothetical protein
VFSQLVFAELLSILGNNDNSADFTYLNGRKGFLLILPQVKSLPTSMNHTQELRWIDGILHHLSGPEFKKDDGAEWLSYFFREKE